MLSGQFIFNPLLPLVELRLRHIVYNKPSLFRCRSLDVHRPIGNATEAIEAALGESDRALGECRCRAMRYMYGPELSASFTPPRSHSI